MMDILHVVETWHSYLIGRNIQMKIDHHSLKYFLNKGCLPWSNTSGYYYDIIYNKGKYNVVVDALSRKYHEDGSLFSLSSPILEWLAEAQVDTIGVVDQCYHFSSH